MTRSGPDLVARRLSSALDDIQTARAMVHANQNEHAQRCLSRADSAVQETIAHLVTVEGAQRPGVPVDRDRLPLEKLDTPATRRMLAALEMLVEAAQDVDTERGWVDEGIGFAEQYDGERLRIGTEIFGPKGRE